MAREMASQVVYSAAYVYVLQENMPIPFSAHVSSLHSQKPQHEMSAPLLSSYKVVPGGRTVNLYKRPHTFWDNVSVPF
jgi:hypothetical protein